MIALDDLSATDAFAARLAGLLRPGDLVALEGDLGTGKTELARMAIRARAGDPHLEVPSPTFTLVQTYEMAGDGEAGAAPIWHFDLYRLGGPDEVVELGWDEARAGGIVLVEWPDRLGPLMPAGHLTLTLARPPGDAAEARTLIVDAGSRWTGRLPDLLAGFPAAVEDA